MGNSNRLNGIKAVFIDIDNTLLDFNKNARDSIIKSFECLNLKYSESVFETFINVNNGLWDKIEKKEITKDYLHDVRFNIIFSKLGISADGHEMEKHFLEFLNYSVIPVDGALDLVKYLSSKYILCSASNAPYVQQIKRLEGSGLKKYLQHCFISERLGVNKPDKRFFECCINGVAPVKKEQTVFIGDSISADIDGAKAFGIKTVWFNIAKKPHYICKNADFIVDDLSEIKNIL